MQLFFIDQARKLCCFLMGVELEKYSIYLSC